MPRKCILICSDSHEPVKAFPRMSEPLYAQGLPGKALRILYSKPEEKWLLTAHPVLLCGCQRFDLIVPHLLEADPNRGCTAARSACGHLTTFHVELICRLLINIPHHLDIVSAFPLMKHFSSLLHRTNKTQKVRYSITIRILSAGGTQLCLSVW